MGITKTAAAPEGHGQTLAGIGQVPQQDAGGEMSHLGPAGHLDHQIPTRGSRAFVRATSPAVIRGEQPLVLEVEQGLKVAVRLQHHGPPMASITSGGSTSRHIFFPPKRGDAIATVATAHRDPCLIDELHGATRWIQLSTLRFSRC